MAVGLVAVCLAFVFLPLVSIWLAADYATGTAEVRDIRLEDGSMVHLGPASALEVAFEPGERRVRLLSGEAYFEIEPDRQRPFLVEADAVTTTVLGTAFDVRLMSAGVGVAVNHGRVSVAAGHAQADLDKPLEAGDWVRIARSGDIERGKDAPELVGGWRSGMLAVKNWSVGDVVDEIRRHYGGKIVLADARLGTQRVTGVYDLGKPVDALRAVAAAHGANARQVSPWLVVVSGF